MGIFDLLGQAVGAVKNLVVSHSNDKLNSQTRPDFFTLQQQDSPIVKKVGNVAGMVAHEIPALGVLS